MMAADEKKTFDLHGTNPDGQSGYTGIVELQKKGGGAMGIKWITGKNHDTVDGIALMGEKTMGAAYGEGLWSIAIYEKKGKAIHAKWTLTSKPEDTGEYDLKGTGDFQGSYTFSGGTPGSMKMALQEDGTYKMSWDLASGHFEGIGLRLGDAVVAVSGDPAAKLGVAAYKPEGNDISGVWTMRGLGGIGKEVWSTKDGAGSTANAPAAPSKGGATVTVDGEPYVLKDSQSAPGRPTSELREYLRNGEDWDGYRKMVAFRLMPLGDGVDAATVAKGTLEQTKKDFPNSFTKEVTIGAKRSVIIFLVVTKDEQVELNVWDYRKTPQGIASAQFVMRNKAPYETQDKFKAEQDAKMDTWMSDLKGLADQALEIMAATAKSSADAAPSEAPAKPKQKEMTQEELSEKISADLATCGSIAQSFVGFMKDGKIVDAVALIHDKEATDAFRKKMVVKLTEANAKLGAMKDVIPDKKATNFSTNKAGQVTYTLAADVVYENLTLRETFEFVRQKDGSIDLVNYNRKAKE